MNSNNRPVSGYDSGADFWRDNAVRYGIDEADIICSRYIYANMQRENSEDELQFCREIFAAMIEATAGTVNPAKLVYPYDFKTAKDRLEAAYYHKNRELNQACAHAIDRAINKSCYSAYHYNLELAAMSVISGHGFQRVNAVLAHQLQRNEYDGRYSGANKKWAQGFTIDSNAHTHLNAHATLVDSFTRNICKLYEDLDAGRFALLGQEENGEFEPVHGYEITRSLMVDGELGFVIAHNPEAVSPYVCWKLSVNGDGERHYDWGIYGDEQAAIDGYNARLFVQYN